MWFSSMKLAGSLRGFPGDFSCDIIAGPHSMIEENIPPQFQEFEPRGTQCGHFVNSKATSKLCLSFPTTSTYKHNGTEYDGPTSKCFWPQPVKYFQPAAQWDKRFLKKNQDQMWFKNMLESLWDLHAIQWGERFLDTQNSNTTNSKRCGHTMHTKVLKSQAIWHEMIFKVKCNFRCKMDPLFLKDYLFTVRQLQNNWSDTS